MLLISWPSASVELMSALGETSLLNPERWSSPWTGRDCIAEISGLEYLLCQSSFLQFQSRPHGFSSLFDPLGGTIVHNLILEGPPHEVGLGISSPPAHLMKTVHSCYKSSIHYPQLWVWRKQTYWCFFIPACWQNRNSTYREALCGLDFPHFVWVFRLCSWEGSDPGEITDPEKWARERTWALVQARSPRAVWLWESPPPFVSVPHAFFKYKFGIRMRPGFLKTLLWDSEKHTSTSGTCQPLHTHLALLCVIPDKLLSSLLLRAAPDRASTAPRYCHMIFYLIPKTAVRYWWCHLHLTQENETEEV